MNKLILLMLMLLCSQHTLADDEVFPISTEIQIGKIRNLLERAPEKGIYVTVGGERAFRGASMYSGIDHLIIFDIAPDIIKFNSINIKLLKAVDKEVYKILRWSSTFDEWKKMDASLLEDDFKWWSDRIRNIKGYDLPEKLNKTGSSTQYIRIREKLMSIYPKVSAKYNNRVRTFLTYVTWDDIAQNQIGSKDPLSKDEFEYFNLERKSESSCVQKFIDEPSTTVDWGNIIDYKSGNYLFDDKLYKRLHDLALQNKITVLKLNLSEDEGLKLMIDTVKLLKSKIAVMDLDNLYLYEYMGESNYRKAINTLLPFGESSSVLIMMHNYKSFSCAQFSMYLGFTFEHVKTWQQQPFLDNFIHSIPQEIYPLLDGRLYESKDELPTYFRSRIRNF